MDVQVLRLLVSYTYMLYRCLLSLHRFLARHNPADLVLLIPHLAVEWLVLSKPYPPGINLLIYIILSLVYQLVGLVLY
jgi:hypothetical protein